MQGYSAFWKGNDGAACGFHIVHICDARIRATPIVMYNPFALVLLSCSSDAMAVAFS